MNIFYEYSKKREKLILEKEMEMNLITGKAIVLLEIVLFVVFNLIVFLLICKML